jgi:hypothetical protein|tara:strand:+ start:385 stop:756 length:372 start_codon:yes stop_codon:yes gene_type:complete
MSTKNGKSIPLRSADQTNSRKILSKGWNQENVIGTIGEHKRILTPFRAANNLGDFLVRKNYVCGGPNQVNASKPGRKTSIGSILSMCDNTGVEGASCNPKFVSDSSDYVRFRKLQAMNKNYTA